MSMIHNFPSHATRSNTILWLARLAKDLKEGKKGEKVFGRTMGRRGKVVVGGRRKRGEKRRKDEDRGMIALASYVSLILQQQLIPTTRKFQAYKSSRLKLPQVGHLVVTPN